MHPFIAEWPNQRFYNGYGDHDDDDDEEVDREYRLKEMKGRSVNVDMATRISRKGALTWWHLDDGGEFTFQTGLPVRSV
jgi:hypothetical protein